MHIYNATALICLLLSGVIGKAIDDDRSDTPFIYGKSTCESSESTDPGLYELTTLLKKQKKIELENIESITDGFKNYFLKKKRESGFFPQELTIINENTKPLTITLTYQGEEHILPPIGANKEIKIVLNKYFRNYEYEVYYVKGSLGICRSDISLIEPKPEGDEIVFTSKICGTKILII